MRKVKFKYHWKYYKKKNEENEFDKQLPLGMLQLSILFLISLITFLILIIKQSIDFEIWNWLCDFLLVVVSGIVVEVILEVKLEKKYKKNSLNKSLPISCTLFSFVILSCMILGDMIFIIVSNDFANPKIFVWIMIVILIIGIEININYIYYQYKILEKLQNKNVKTEAASEQKMKKWNCVSLFFIWIVYRIKIIINFGLRILRLKESFLTNRIELLIANVTVVTVIIFFSVFLCTFY